MRITRRRLGFGYNSGASSQAELAPGSERRGWQVLDELKQELVRGS